MRFALSVSALAALAATVLAQTADFNPIFTPTNNEQIPAGKPYVVTWKSPAKYLNDKVMISLIGGASRTTQQPIGNIATNIDNSAGRYTWVVDASLGDLNVYGLEIKLVNDPSIFQYSMPFQIKKSNNPPPASGTAAATVGTYSSPATTLVNAVPTTVCDEEPAPTVTKDCDEEGISSFSKFVVPTNSSGPVAAPTGRPNPAVTSASQPGAASSGIAPVYAGAPAFSVASLNLVAAGLVAAIAL